MTHAITTLVSGGKGYLQGAKALGNSAKKWLPNVPRILLMEDGAYTPDDEQEMLVAGWDILLVPSIRSQPCKFNAERWPRTFTKLQAWSLVDFDKVLFLDADCFIVGSVEELFDIDFQGVVAARVNSNIDARFNSGVMVLQPNSELHQDLVTTIQTRPVEETDAHLSDQGFLNVYFKERVRLLPDRFNWRNWKKCCSDLRIAHIRPKPWETASRTQYQADIIKQWNNAL